METFGLVIEGTIMINVLQHIREIMFQEQKLVGVTKVSICTYHREQHIEQHLVHCKKIDEVFVRFSTG